MAAKGIFKRIEAIQTRLRQFGRRRNFHNLNGVLFEGGEPRTQEDLDAALAGEYSDVFVLYSITPSPLRCEVLRTMPNRATSAVHAASRARDCDVEESTQAEFLDTLYPTLYACGFGEQDALAWSAWWQEADDTIGQPIEDIAEPPEEPAGAYETACDIAWQETGSAEKIAAGYLVTMLTAARVVRASKQTEA